MALSALALCSRALLKIGAQPIASFDEGTAEAEVAAPFDRLPLLVPAGAILPLTGTSGVARLHDEPSRLLRLFPGPGTGESRFVLVEDDGITEGGPVTRLTLTLSWTPAEVRLRAEAAGGHPLPDRIEVALPAAEGRPLRLDGRHTF